jgi:hypothetical protein
MTNETITFLGRTYRVTDELGVGPATAAQLGIVRQCIIEGERGAVMMLQVFANGTRRAISGTGGHRVYVDRG